MTAVGTCSAPGCQITDGGSCIEGFANLAECPNFSKVKQEAQPDAGIDHAALDSKPLGQDVEVADTGIALSSGRALTVEEGHALAGARSTRIVVLMGMVKSGKTTVLAELWEGFRKGPFGGHLFAGSRTIMGFEQICYFARAVSQREIEDTDRTKSGEENNLLHLDLVDRSNGRKQSILISDLSGELFERAVESRQNVHAIPYLQRADHVVLFADAEKLGNNSEKHLLVNQLTVLLRSCIEERRVEPNCRVTLVVSRHDLLPSDTDEAFMDSLKNRICERASPYFEKPVDFLELAARPESGPEDAYGLEELLSAWLAKDDNRHPRVPTLVSEVGSNAREIDRFSYKVSRDDR